MAKKVTKKSTKTVSKAKGKPKAKATPKAPSKAPAKKPAAKAKAATIKPKAASVKPKAAPVKKALSKPAPKVAPKPVKKVPATAAKAPVQPKKKPAAVSPHEAFTEPSETPTPAVAMTGTPATPNTPVEQSRAFAIEAARLLSDDKCTDIIVLDVSKLGAEQDFMVIGSGTSDRQMRSVLHDVAELGTATGHTIAHQSVDDRATWVLADFFDVVIHLFEPNTRAYYDLEMMWGDAPKVSWERAPGDKPKSRNRRVVVGAGGSESPATAED